MLITKKIILTNPFFSINKHLGYSEVLTMVESLGVLLYNKTYCGDQQCIKCMAIMQRRPKPGCKTWHYASLCVL